MIRRTRLAFEDHYTQVPNAWVRDARLTRKARGLLVELMSHRVGWNITIDSLIRDGVEQRDAIRSMLIELEKFGYLTRERERNADGTLAGTDYIITDPWADSPTSDEPTSENPTLVDPPLKKTNLSEDQSQELGAPPRAKEKRGTRMVEGWMPSPGVAAAIRKECPNLDLAREHKKFIDHWIEIPGQRGLKITWDGTWRNWMRRACEFAEQRNPYQARVDLDAQWAAFLNEDRPARGIAAAALDCLIHPGYPIPCERCKREAEDG